MRSAPAQASSRTEHPRRHRRRRGFIERLRPVNWKKVGAYVLAYSVAAIIAWKI
jgi:hypothetical protein